MARQREKKMSRSIREIFFAWTLLRVIIYEVVVQEMCAKIYFHELMSLWGYPMVAGVWPSSDQRKSVVDSTISLFHRQGTPFFSVLRGQDFLHLLIYCTEDKKRLAARTFKHASTVKLFPSFFINKI